MAAQEASRHASGQRPRPTVSILGVPVSNLSRAQAVALVVDWIDSRTTHAAFIVNAHTCNLAADEPAYRAVLERASAVLGDGIGVRIAARLRGVRIKENLVGTDFVPQLFNDAGGRGYRYFLLGADAESIQRAAAYCRTEFPGWTQAGYRHGYMGEAHEATVIDEINLAAPDLLLVGMGNPLQEQSIARALDRLEVPVSIGVGGLFDHWAGNLARAPGWMRRNGLEWLQLLLQQPHKWRRYLLGNPLFVARILLALPADRKISLAPGRLR